MCYASGNSVKTRAVVFHVLCGLVTAGYIEHAVHTILEVVAPNILKY